MQSAGAVVTGFVVVACLVVIVAIAARDLHHVMRQREVIHMWDTWQAQLGAPHNALKVAEARNLVNQVQKAVGGPAKGHATLVGSYKSGAFHPVHSDIDIKLSLMPGTSMEGVAQNLENQLGFRLKHGGSKYHLFTRGPVGALPPVDVSVSYFDKPDLVHCAGQDPVALDALGFLVHVARTQAALPPDQHLVVRQWRPH
jgi:hypothetical protein